MASLTEQNCKEIFRNAYENRYTWNENFKGYHGKCTLLAGGKKSEGQFRIGRDFKPEIQNIDNDQVLKAIASQLFEVTIHRVKRDFQSIHSKNNFNLLKNSHNGIEMIVSGKNEGDKYRVKNECINMVYRKIHGTIIQIFVQEFLDTGIGFLSKKYSSQQLDIHTLKANSQKMEYEDEFFNFGKENMWLLRSRTIKYSIKNKEEVIQKFIFDDLCLLK